MPRDFMFSGKETINTALSLTRKRVFRWGNPVFIAFERCERKRKTIAMMRVFGCDGGVCERNILGAYRPAANIGFIIGTFYQYGLLKIMINVVFADIDNVPTYNFDFNALCITAVLFVVIYELAMYFYQLRIRKISLKTIMSE